MSADVQEVPSDIKRDGTLKPSSRGKASRRNVGRRSRSRNKPNVLAGIGGFVWLGIIIIPIYYIVITSVRPQAGFFSANQLLPPANPTLSQYALVLQNDYFLYLANSLIITILSALAIVFVSLMAGYAIVRSKTRFIRLSFSFFLLGLAIPVQATIVPLFFMFSKAGLYDTLAALILPSIGFGIPLTVLILVNFIRDVPKELFESMTVEGASNWRMFVSLVIPLSQPAIVTVALYNALLVWNGFLFPLILTQSPDKRVLPLSLWTFQGQYSVNIPGTLAAVVLATLPLFILYIFGRRQLVSGMTAGFSK